MFITLGCVYCLKFSLFLSFGMVPVDQKYEIKLQNKYTKILSVFGGRVCLRELFIVAGCPSSSPLCLVRPSIQLQYVSAG